MTHCLFDRKSALTLWLGAIAMVPGCIDPRSIGEEPDSAGTESGGSGGTGESGGSGAGGSNSDGPGELPKGETGVDCPAILTPECMECDCQCVAGGWVCPEEPVDDCTDQACGAPCCTEEEPECTDASLGGLCTADGQCVGAPPPLLGFCEGELQSGFEQELSVQNGCADMVIYAHDAMDEQAIVLSINQGLVQDVIDTGVPVHVELTATDPALALEARAGFNVTMHECNDVLEPGVDIIETWGPTGGTVVIDVVPGEFELPVATVQLVDVVLARENYPGPAPITVNLAVTDITVGWLPG
ncbi:MAG: hypothetical protein AAGF11_41465 [Myxococcota bacterium]